MMMMTPNMRCANPAIASRLQSDTLVGRVAELVRPHDTFRHHLPPP
jgi:hypothetical protein